MEEEEEEEGEESKIESRTSARARHASSIRTTSDKTDLRKQKEGLKNPCRAIHVI